jgi:hypothetical protein
MPTLEENRRFWDDSYDWSKSGDEWSSNWGGTEMEWNWVILPRIKRFIPTTTILEIGPGFGRWSQFLLGLCQKLIVVDLSEKCIAACRERFSGHSHILYYVNDGKSLDMIPDDSIDFVFSFDSLVHAEEDVMASYVSQLSRKLTQNGAGFIHHSNLGEYPSYLTIYRKLPGVRRVLSILGIKEDFFHGRASNMTAMKFSAYANGTELQCIGQEKVNWASRRLIDCMSSFTRKTSRWAQPNVVVRNKQFMQEASVVRRLAPLYSMEDFPDHRH